ncbi:LOW QUALITY PROTEIN: hypothetical protein Cgig2_008471 [Carnegiea gigantea]|uniref:Uncharacterized protein n=1 Tax=Carnegiea gigantea TaxID=171969 RepID=A0A9Q1JUE0_9CARY|nr:LOW QUALITY PROTEIN: hypothetical protein Cgig2_008471 [Carnegiea gigantea]
MMCCGWQLGKSKKESDEDGSSHQLNVNDEYKEVFRTQSYTNIWSKVQDQLKGSTTSLDHIPVALSSSPASPSSPPSSSSTSSSSNNNNNGNCLSSSPLPDPFYMQLLEPRQEAAIDIIKSSNLRSLLIDYFDASLEACILCESLLRGIQKTRFNHRLIERAMNLSNGGNYTTDQCREIVIRDVAAFAGLNNPLSVITNNGAVDFHKIHDKYALLLQKLLTKGRKIKRRHKFTRFYKKTAGYGFVIVYTVLAIAMLTLATHSVVGVLAAPGLLMTISRQVIKKASGGSTSVSFLKHLASQLDEAARGVYTLNNDFDTVGMLARRVYDEVEHMRALSELCMRNRMSQEVVKEALRELCVHEDGFVEQLEELEEHIYLCFLTINRSRRAVIHEILSA